MPAQTDTVIANANGTVTVTATGSWVWAFSSTPKTNQGIDVTASDPCDDRFGAGWAVAWDDPSDPGFAETFHNDNGTATVNLGSKGVIASNTEDHVLYSKTDPCGTFVLTNTPASGDGYLMGSWSASHIYANAASVPPEVCAVTYDLGPGKTAPHPPESKLAQDDNSVWWSLYNTGTWSPTQGNPACVTLSVPTPAPPTTTPPTTAALVKTATPPPPATSPARTLAFTGNGPVDDALGVLGAVLVILGFFMYFFGIDVRRAVGWLVGQ